MFLLETSECAVELEICLPLYICPLSLFTLLFAQETDQYGLLQ